MTLQNKPSHLNPSSSSSSSPLSLPLSSYCPLGRSTATTRMRVPSAWARARRRSPPTVDTSFAVRVSSSVALASPLPLFAQRRPVACGVRRVPLYLSSALTSLRPFSWRRLSLSLSLSPSRLNALSSTPHPATDPDIPLLRHSRLPVRLRRQPAAVGAALPHVPHHRHHAHGAQRGRPQPRGAAPHEPLQRALCRRRAQRMSSSAFP